MIYSTKFARKPNKKSGFLLNTFIVRTDTIHPKNPTNGKTVEASVGDNNNRL